MSRIRADRYTNRAGTGAPTFADGVNVVGITSVNPGAGTTSMLVTGDLSVISGTIKGASELSISGITSSITDTAVDVFVYDTSKDSDGGAWRKRTQNTSWYNETLNTEYRGSRREFPSVAVIVADATTDKITIYDGDDPDLPMWMVFSAANPQGILGWSTSNYTRFKVAALNGILTSVSNDGGHLFKFVEDYVEIIYSSTNYPITSSRTIGGRNVQKVSNSSGGATRTYVVVTYAMNDVAMTVLPNAPVDSATGLPIPTIAVATNGGVSVIKDDGTVVDITSPSTNNGVGNIQLDSEYVYFTSPDSGAATEDRMLFVYGIPSADINNTFGYNDGDDYLFTTFNSPSSVPSLAIEGSVDGDIANMVVYDKKIFSALPSGIAYLDEYSTTTANGSVAYITSDYNTGYMQGDVKGAFLSDTSTVSIPGSNFVTNGDFSNGSTGWSVQSGWTVSSNTATCDGTNGAYISQPAGDLPINTPITVTVTITAYTSGTIRLGSTGIAPAIQHSGTGTYSTTFRTRSGGGSGVEIMSVNFVGTIDNVIVTLAEEDRSVNDKGLQVFGTITKTAVATGADLVTYGPFTTSNYLKQPYNSGLDFGTGDFSVTWWMKITGDISGTGFIFDRRNTGSRVTAYYTAADAGRLYFQTYQSSGNGESQMYAENIDNYKDNWTCYTLTRSGDTMVIYINGKVGYRAILDVRDVDDATAQLYIGVRHNETDAVTQGELSLMRFSKSVPSAEQIKKMYEDEKVLFQENAKATLYGSSDTVTALAFDDTTELLHVGTSAGRSEFQGLRRINNTTTAVTTALSASNELVAEQ